MNRSIFSWSLIGFIASIGLISCAQGTVLSDEPEDEGDGGSGGSGTGGKGGSGVGVGSGPTGSASASSGGGSGGAGSGSSSSSSGSGGGGASGSSSSSSGGGPKCSNGACEAGETCMNCPADCGPCGPVCGDGVCSGGETCMACPFDCGPCQGGNCAHDLCVEGTPLNPACDPCVGLVCSVDDFCCMTAWDIVCIDEAVQFCGVVCP